MISYTPSMAGRAARMILPALKNTMPAPLYARTYEALYASYKGLLYRGYGVKAGATRLFGSDFARLKTRLTYKLLPHTMGGRRALENAFEVVALAERRKIAGALVECGVAQGGTAAMMALASKALGSDSRTKWLFDSYEGLPEPTAEDYVNGQAGEFIRPLPKGSCLGTVEQVSELFFDKLGFQRDEVRLIKGWFQDTIPVEKVNIGQIAVLRLDGDWYESTKVPLENLYDQLTPGGFVIIDDYATCFGSRRAVDEFRSDRAIATPLLEDGRGGVWFEKPVARG